MGGSRSAAATPPAALEKGEVILEGAAADARLSYGSAPSQYGELYLPAGEEPHPLLVVLHGGFWRCRYDLSHMSHLCAAYAARGIATFNVEYRRVGEPGGGFPGTFEDVLLAVELASRLSERFPLRRGVPGVLGFSAGGHLAAWAGARHHLERTDRFAASAAEIPLVVSLAGVTQLHAAWEDGLSQGAAEAFLGGSPLTTPERYAASPALTPRSALGGTEAGVSHVRPDKPPPSTDGRPTDVVIAHGMADDTVPHWYSESYADTAIERGDRVHLLSFDGVGHYDLIDPRSPAFNQVLELVQLLTRSTLRGKHTVMEGYQC
jgi:acetyl esterase/lipase